MTGIVYHQDILLGRAGFVELVYHIGMHEVVLCAVCHMDNGIQTSLQDSTRVIFVFYSLLSAAQATCSAVNVAKRPADS